MTDRELLQQVLDAWQDHWVNDHQSALLETIRANCAKEIYKCARCGEVNPAEIHTCTPQEPLPAKSKGALSHEENKQHNKKILDKFYEENAHLYTAPPQREWQWLTDEEIEQVIDKHWNDPSMFVEAMEQALKEKNG
jgi:hypothetical protein